MSFSRKIERTELAMRATSDLSMARVGGVFRYSMMGGSIPELRMSPRVLRDVPHAGL